MRTPPEHVAAAVRAYDPGLTLKWDGRIERWLVVSDGRELFTLDHLDGTAMLALDGYTDEILNVLHRADNRVHGPTRIRAMRRAAREREYRAEQRRLREGEEVSKATRQALEVSLRGGPKPFVHLTSDRRPSRRARGQSTITRETHNVA